MSSVAAERDRAQPLLFHWLNGRLIGVDTAGDFLAVADEFEESAERHERAGDLWRAARHRQAAADVRAAVRDRDRAELEGMSAEYLHESGSQMWAAAIPDEATADAFNDGKIAYEVRACNSTRVQ